MKTQTNLRVKITFILAVVLFLEFVVFAVTIQAGPELPPRIPPSPGVQDEDERDGNDDSAPLKAYIVLQAGATPAGSWGLVQWQNSAGGWQDVTGWQGPVSTNNRWTVLSKDFGAGPFRWVLKTESSGSITGVSPTFKLPAGAGETVTVVIP